MTNNEKLEQIVAQEMKEECYEFYSKVENGDTVLDLGCSKGYFYFANQHKNIRYFGVDGDLHALSEFVKKADNKPNILQGYIAEVRGLLNETSFFYSDEGKHCLVQTLTFKELLQYVGSVDFLKFDIEGYETCLFGDMDFFCKNVKRFGGEIHLEHVGVMEMMVKLSEEKRLSYRLHSVDGLDITDRFWNNKDYYQEILISGYVITNPFLHAYKTTTKIQSYVRVDVNFVNGAFIELKTNNPNKEYNVRFKNGEQSIFSCNLKSNHWARTNPTYCLPYDIELIDTTNSRVVWSHRFNCEDKRVFIPLDTKALGDTLCWLPYVEEFQRVNKCHVICSTFLNDLVRNTYPDIEFVEPGTTVNNIYAQFSLGIYFGDIANRHKNDPRAIPMAQVASDILGLPYKELSPKLATDKHDRPISKRYVCIGTESTTQAKHWNNPTGWQEVVDYLTAKGISVISIRQNGSSNLRNIQEITGKEISNLLPILEHCEAFIGLGSGLSWLTHAMGKKVVLISGFSKPWCEFTTPYRVINEQVCNGCFNDVNEQFDRSNWNWCPRKMNFECTKQISSKLVITQLDKIL